ncbi:hypothetical protein Ahy_A04g021494 isoform F [Arachis hypogaea]|uniref:Squalene monooxygenase n=1 Tax=Arachis hypogaea TaxID=3818 RepID=A0A445DKK2_ARAHY|nr:hypothetical protein Ahy_A04g021494 isoform F [Arachis hypogaea]
MCDLVLRLNHFNFSFTCNNNNLILNNSLFLRIESHSSTRNTHICKGRKLNDSGSGTGADVIIVGAGVAGSALAYTLAKQIDAQEVLGYILYKDRENIKLPYPLETYHADVAGRSFHNGRFIQSVQMNEGTVTSLLWKDNKTVIGVQYKSKDGKEQKAYAPLTIVCDGCFSKLRRSLCHPKVEVPSCFVGLILENCQLPFENHGHVILANPSPILFYRISSTEVRCLVDIPGQKVPPIGNGKMANFLKTMVAPQCAFGIIFPIIRDEGVRQMFFPATVPEFYRSPSAR